MTKKEKLFVRAFAFLSSLIILISSIFYNGFNVFADGNVSFTSVYSVSDICVTKSDYDLSYLYSSDSPEISTWSNAVSSGLYVTQQWYDANLNVIDGYTDYVVSCYSSNNTGFNFTLVPSDSFIICYSDSAQIYYSELPSGNNGFYVFPLLCHTVVLKYRVSFLKEIGRWPDAIRCPAWGDGRKSYETTLTGQRRCGPRPL